MNSFSRLRVQLWVPAMLPVMLIYFCYIGKKDLSIVLWIPFKITCCFMAGILTHHTYALILNIKLYWTIELKTTFIQHSHPKMKSREQEARRHKPSSLYAFNEWRGREAVAHPTAPYSPHQRPQALQPREPQHCFKASTEPNSFQ